MTSGRSWKGGANVEESELVEDNLSNASALEARQARRKKALLISIALCLGGIAVYANLRSPEQSGWIDALVLVWIAICLIGGMIAGGFRKRLVLLSVGGLFVTIGLGAVLIPMSESPGRRAGKWIGLVMMAPLLLSVAAAFALQFAADRDEVGTAFDRNRA